MQVLCWEWLEFKTGSWLSLRIAVPQSYWGLPFSQELVCSLCRSDRISRACFSLYLGPFAKNSLRIVNGFCWNSVAGLPLKKSMQSKLFTGLGITLRCSEDVWKVEVGTVCALIQAATTRWHHDSGNKVQINLKTKGIWSAVEVLLQTQNMGWICKPFCEPGSGFPPNADWSRTGSAPGDRVGFMAWGGNHVNVWLATRLILAVGYAWRASMYLKQNLRPRFRKCEPAWAKARRGLHDPAVNRCKKVSHAFIVHLRWAQAWTQKQYPDTVSCSPTSLLTCCHCERWVTGC